MKKIAILGFGTVGSGIADIIDCNRKSIEKQLGEEIEIKYILDLRDFPGNKYEKNIVKDFDIILKDPEISVVCEAMGGSHPAYDFSKAAILAGKNVVTSNKEVVANFGAELLSLAKDNNVRYLFEASVGGGIPIIRPITNSLSGNEICSVYGILNGTTNYILTEMVENGKTFEEALLEAQQKGYAEKDPTADVDGIDAKRKICILAALSFGMIFSEGDVSNSGIRAITPDDVSAAQKLNAKIKLIGYASKTEEGIRIGVRAHVVKKSNPLYSVDGVFNGILVSGNALGDVMFYGSGAGKLPTASAVVSDIMDILLHPGYKENVAFEIGTADMIDKNDHIGTFMVRTDAVPSSFDEKISSGIYIISDTTEKAIIKENKNAVIYPIL